ncbi:MAG: hypothetical protein E7537_02445 [Ruminococcaceae bacterium]|nr:hypothetical protein [Oscillospiraceae bacterium]
MNSKNFSEKQQRAIEQMFDMNKRSTSSPMPNPEKPNQPPKPPKTDNSFLGGFSLPFLDNLKKDGDMTLILGILLLLLSEKADKRLLFALIYILL